MTYLAKILWNSGLDTTMKVIEIYQGFTASNTARLLSINDAKFITTVHRYTNWRWIIYSQNILAQILDVRQ